MPVQFEKIIRLLNDIEINCDPLIGSRECIQFELDCLELIRDSLPPFAKQAIAVAEQYRQGAVPLRVVTDTVVSCWDYLDQNHKHVSEDDPAVSAIRAVIFPLKAQEDPERRDVVDHLSFFLEFVNNVEPHWDEQEALLRTHFQKCF